MNIYSLEALKEIQKEMKSDQLKLNEFRKELNKVIDFISWIIAYEFFLVAICSK